MSNNNTTTKKTTFWKFLTDNTIEIPIIQRDYAQGRERKEHLRKNFLSDLKDALDNGKELKLDFVYGSKENNKLNPLDGQQRLTTLWLLHWYIALRSGNLNDDDVCEKLKRFTYETRISSREFCKGLCNAENFQNYYFGNIVEYIKNQTWFYSAWKQDPTIQSMLRMLGGTKNEKGEPNNDGIEQVFNRSLRRQKSGWLCLHKLRKYQFKVYYDKLTDSNKCPIIFYYLPLNEFKLTDDLYIKMNARGEQLTSFENFKADLIGYITKQKDNDNLEERKKWETLLDEKNGIPIKMDTDWTNIFWENKSPDYTIDEIYYAFLNRFFLNKIICQKKENGEYFYTADSLEKDNLSFAFLYGNKGNDSNIQYNDIGIYKYLQGNIPYVFFDSLQNTLNAYNLYNINDAFPKWVDSKFEFIPKYIDGNEISTLGQKERVVFHAVCRYFEKDVLKKSSFKQWMRVIWNIVENSGIETISAMIGALRLIDELAEHSHDIYTFLANYDEKNISFAKDQVKEEIIKAKKILSDNEWESKIIEAETFSFFKGAIRFLFTDGNGEINWGDFDTKWENAQKYFDEQNPKEDHYNNLRIFINKCSKESELKNIIYDIIPNSWKTNLLNENLKNTTDYFLSNKKDSASECLDKKWLKVQNDLVKSELLNNLTYNGSHVNGCHLRDDKYGQIALFPSGANSEQKKYVVGNIRNTILSKLWKDREIKCNQKINNCDFFWGWDIRFEYSDNYFTYYTNNTVCLMNQNWDGKKLRDASNNNEPQNNYFYSVDESESAETFLKKLNCLIAQQQADEKGDSCFNECDNNPASLQ